MWSPEIRKRRGPLYVALADALAEDLAAGRIRPGARLPTHRELADRLGVTIGTVTRGYAEAARRGLLSGEVGRGTFVRGASSVRGAPRASCPPGARTCGARGGNGDASAWTRAARGPFPGGRAGGFPAAPRVQSARTSTRAVTRSITESAPRVEVGAVAAGARGRPRSKGET